MHISINALSTKKTATMIIYVAMVPALRSFNATPTLRPTDIIRKRDIKLRSCFNNDTDESPLKLETIISTIIADTRMTITMLAICEGSVDASPSPNSRFFTLLSFQMLYIIYETIRYNGQHSIAAAKTTPLSVI